MSLSLDVLSKPIRLNISPKRLRTRLPYLFLWAGKIFGSCFCMWLGFSSFASVVKQVLKCVIFTVYFRNSFANVLNEAWIKNRDKNCGSAFLFLFLKVRWGKIKFFLGWSTCRLFFYVFRNC